MLSWAATAEGAINIATRLSGPPNSKLRELTVRFDLLDADDRVVREEWHTFDLTGIERGGPEDIIVILPAAETAVEGLSPRRLLDPTPEEERRIPELRI